MGCRCNERRQAIVRTVKAATQADVQTIATETAFVLKSTVQDAGNALRQSVVAAKARLSRR